MWKIGDLDIDGRVVLGPMSGVTSSGYREFMKPFGSAVSVSEMVSDVGIIHSIEKTMMYVDFDRNYPTGLQLFGSDPEIVAKAAAEAIRRNPNIDFFDINMGCPAKKVIRNGSGSAMMKDPVRCGDMVRSVKAAVDVPVTAKIRLGQDGKKINFRQVIDELTSAGADAIALHVRTVEERYSGSPHYDLVEGLQSEMSVPLVISGNIYSLEDAIEAVRITGASAVMVARGGVGNPFLLTQIDHYFRTGEKLPNPNVSQQMDWCISLADVLIREKGEETAIRRMRSFAPRFVAGYHRCRGYRRRLATETVDRESLVRLLTEIREKMGGEVIRTEGLCGRPGIRDSPLDDDDMPDE